MSAKNSFRIKKGRRNGGTPTPTSLPGCSCSMNNTNKTNGNDVGVGVPPFLRPFFIRNEFFALTNNKKKKQTF